MVLDESTGTDILGDMIEASDWSKNKLLYGDIHNMGHTALAFIHDPDGGHQVLFTIPTKQLVSMFEISYPIDYVRKELMRFGNFYAVSHYLPLKCII